MTMSTDQFGIKKLHETVPGGREFYLPEIDIPPVEITRWHTLHNASLFKGARLRWKFMEKKDQL